MPSSKIRLLDDQTINKIAAGEVIENPASVIKELVENALDAGATQICVEIITGGRQLIRVSDNGCGMSPDDALLCLERHATSKIKEVEDIHQLATMGFRGEALPSIASISKFTLLTRSSEEKEPTAGTMVIVDGGKIFKCAPAARSPGTTIEVKSLFFNVPVRKKFQRSPSYDTQEILKMLTLLSLGHPNIAFELISDQKSLLHMPPLEKEFPFLEQLAKRIEPALGQDFFRALVPLSFQHEPYQIQGYIGSPTYHRHNRTGQYLFINHRAVSSPLIAFAVREGYGTTLPAQRYPAFILHIQMPGALVDVNVHPQKKEVRLRQEQKLKEKLTQAIQEALHTSPSPSQQEPSYSYPFAFSSPAFDEPPPFNPFPLFSFDSSPLKLDFSPHPPCPMVAESPNLFTLSPPHKPAVLATLPGYLLVEPHSLPSTFLEALCAKSFEGLCLIDQQAAYGRLYYERLLKQLESQEENPSFMQPLLFPLTLEFSAAESAALKEHLKIIQGMGFGIEEFGERTFIINALPHFLAKENLHACLSALLDDLIHLKDHRHLKREKEKQMVLTACRAALPATKRLSIEEAQLLIQQLLNCEKPTQSPTGKPTAILLSFEHLRQLFEVT